MTTATRLSIPDALSRLGAVGGPDEIAAYLAEHGYRGERCGGTRCPVADCLRRTTGRDVAPAVTTWVAVDYPGSVAEQRGDLPGAVTRFIGEFDQGVYPLLVAPAADGDGWS